MLDLKIKSGRRYVAPADLVRVLGFERALMELGDMVEALIAQIDIIEGDADAEECGLEDSFTQGGYGLGFAKMGGAGCSVSEPDAVAYPEWHTMPGSTKANHMPVMHNEDDEEDDPSGQCDEDGVNTVLGALRGDGPGCEISDPDQAVDDVGCDEEGGDMLPVLDWRAHDQTEPIVPTHDADGRIMATYRDRIRDRYYVKRESPWPGQPPIWHRVGQAISANLN